MKDTETEAVVEFSLPAASSQGGFAQVRTVVMPVKGTNAQAFVLGGGGPNPGAEALPAVDASANAQEGMSDDRTASA